MSQSFKIDRSMLAECAADYSAALTSCDSLSLLQALVGVYAELALDAVPIVNAMTEADFTEFRRGLARERKGRFAGEKFAERFSAILMPLPMFRIAQIADRYKAPFGVTWQRCRDLRPDLLAVQESTP